MEAQTSFKTSLRRFRISGSWTPRHGHVMAGFGEFLKYPPSCRGGFKKISKWSGLKKVNEQNFFFFEKPKSNAPVFVVTKQLPPSARLQVTAIQKSREVWESKHFQSQKTDFHKLKRFSGIGVGIRFSHSSMFLSMCFLHNLHHFLKKGSPTKTLRPTHTDFGKRNLSRP